MISVIVKVELSVTVSAIQAAVEQIMGTYSYTYRKAWLAKQRALANLFDD